MRTWKRAVAVYYPQTGDGMERSGVLSPNLSATNLWKGFGEGVHNETGAPPEKKKQKNNLISARHYGFRKNMSTVHAFQNLLAYIDKSKRHGVYTRLFTLISRAI